MGAVITLYCVISHQRRAYWYRAAWWVVTSPSAPFFSFFLHESHAIKSEEMCRMFRQIRRLKLKPACDISSAGRLRLTQASSLPSWSLLCSQRCMTSLWGQGELGTPPPPDTAPFYTTTSDAQWRLEFFFFIKNTTAEGHFSRSTGFKKRLYCISIS